MVRKQRTKIKTELQVNENELKKITDGIVDIERRKILSEFLSEEIYLKLKKQLDKDFRSKQIEIENLKNSMKYFTQQDNWYESIETISSTFNNITEWSTKEKRSIIKMVLDKVILNHDSKNQLHHLDVHLKIPLILTDYQNGGEKHVPQKSGYNSLINMGNLTLSRSFYSTVTLFAKLRGWSTLQPLITATW